MLAVSGGNVFLGYHSAAHNAALWIDHPDGRRWLNTGDLARIDEEGSAKGEPELAVLVVRQSDGLPGQGWWIGAARQYDYAGAWEGPDARALVTRLQERAFRHWGGKTPQAGCGGRRDG